jgi:hypothetical protein
MSNATTSGFSFALTKLARNTDSNAIVGGLTSTLYSKCRGSLPSKHPQPLIFPFG